jgi:hypothetical protein
MEPQHVAATLYVSRHLRFGPFRLCIVAIVTGHSLVKQPSGHGICNTDWRLAVLVPAPDPT